MRTPGSLIRAAREAANLSLRGLGDQLGVSAPYVHDVEHDRRRLATVRWASLRRALPGLDMRKFAEATVASGPVEVDPSMLSVEQRAALVEALIATAAA